MLVIIRNKTSRTNPVFIIGIVFVISIYGKNRIWDISKRITSFWFCDGCFCTGSILLKFSVLIPVKGIHISSINLGNFNLDSLVNHFSRLNRLIFPNKNTNRKSFRISNRRRNLFHDIFPYWDAFNDIHFPAFLVISTGLSPIRVV